jgi:hypothetical protein
LIAKNNYSDTLTILAITLVKKINSEVNDGTMHLFTAISLLFKLKIIINRESTGLVKIRIDDKTRKELNSIIDELNMKIIAESNNHIMF